MSLQVWLPLDGDLRNLGASKVDTISGTAAYGMGKISGSALSYINSATNLELYCEKLNNVSTFSICFWAKSSKDTSDTDWASPIHFGAKAPGSSTIDRGFRFGKDNRASSAGYPIGVYHNSGNIIANSNHAFTTSADWDTWVHISFIYDGTHVTGYKNGVLVFSNSNGLNGVLSGNIYLCLERSNSYINDLRIYDHCLSAAEVHEISLGLVLHYKLDSLVKPNLLSGNINSVHQWTADGVTCTLEDGSLKVVDEGTSNRRIYNSVSNVWVSGVTYTVSFDAKASVNNYIILASRSVVDLAPETLLTTEWLHYSALINCTGTATSGTLSIQSKTSNETFWIKNIKLEIGTEETSFILPGKTDTIEDSSGYNHCAKIISGTLTTNVDTARYSCCTASSTPVEIKNDTSEIPIALTTHNSYSFSIWLKTNVNTSHWIYYMGDNSGGCRGLWITDEGKPHFAYNGSGAFTSNIVVNDNQWHHICFTVKDATSKCYVDGIDYGGSTSTKTTVTASNNIRLIYNQKSAAEKTDNLSDFRIYCTTLSAEDIKLLYDLGAKVDNTNKYHTFEFVEESDGSVDSSDIITTSITLDDSNNYTTTSTTVTLFTYTNTSGSSTPVNVALTTRTYSLHIPFTSAGKYVISWPKISAYNLVGSYRTRSGSSTRTAYYKYLKIYILLAVYNSLGETKKTIVLDSVIVNSKGLTSSLTSTQYSVSSSSRTILLPKDFTNSEEFSYAQLQLVYIGGRFSASGTFTSKQQITANPVKPQILRTGQFVNRIIDEINFDEHAQILMDGALLGDNFIEI